MPAYPTKSLTALSIILSFQVLAPAASAQDAPLTAQDADIQSQDDADAMQADEDINQIIVYGARLRGQVDAPQPPILTLDQEDIAAYGASSIAELIEALGPQVSSGRGRGDSGRPVILVNGVRISSFRELRSYPPEAIERTEVFSEEVAQRFGYSPDQRVVNIILKDNYSSTRVELEYGQPFDGGFSQQEVQGTYLRIDGPSRFNVNLEWENTSPLTEGERGVVQSDSGLATIPGDPDPADYRTLVSDSAGLEATVNWTTTLGESGNSISANATYERDDSLRLQGLDSVTLFDPVGSSVVRRFNAADPLAVDQRSNSYSAGATLNAGLGEWQLTGTVDATISDTVSRSQLTLDTSALIAAAAAGDLALDADLGTFTDAGFDEAQSDTYTVNALVTARGNPIYLPGGEVSLTGILGYRANGIESFDTGRPDVVTDLDRTRWQAGLNVGIPITSRDEDFGSALGDISLNLSGAIFEQSDFGTLYDVSAGVTWGILEGLTLSATYVERENSPSLTQLGAPQITTFNVPVFDFTNNETVLATVTTGGNPNLQPETQSDWKFGLNWELPFIENGSFQVEYFNNHSDNVTDSFPVLTSAIEAAYPDRVTRDATGMLTSIDRRFVTFAERDVERLQFGLNLSGRFGGGDEDSGDGNRGGGNRGDGGNRRGGADTADRPAATPAGGEGGQQGRRGPRDPERLAQLRAEFCQVDPDTLMARFNDALEAEANGEPAPVGSDGEPLTIPPRMLQRLTGEDGRIDPERFNAMRERICSEEAAQIAEGPRGERGAGGPPGGPRAGEGNRGGGGGRRGGGGRGFDRFGGGGDGPPVGRWFTNLQYTLDLENTLLIAPGVPLLDLLDGDALSGGGQSRHSINWRGGAFYDGFGAFLSASYTGASRINGSGLAGSSDLYFDDFATVNIRTFVDLGQRDNLVAAVPFLKGSRIGFDIDNIFDARQRVTDSDGNTPLAYQPFLIDPRGRSFEIEFRKMF